MSAERGMSWRARRRMSLRFKVLANPEFNRKYLRTVESDIGTEVRRSLQSVSQHVAFLGGAMSQVLRRNASVLVVAALPPAIAGGALHAYAAARPAPVEYILAQAPAPQSSQPTPQERVAMLRQWLQASGQQLRSYEWIETTAVSLGGVEKVRRQSQCYYGADGRLQKVQLSETKQDSGSTPPGPLGRLAKKAGERKKEELTGYMKSAVELVHAYIPPEPARIQRAMDAGGVSVNVVQPGRLVRVDIREYLKPGDVLGVEIELPTNRLVALSVASYLDDPSDAVVLKVGISVLPDGTLFPGQIVLDAKAKDMRVAIQNSGHRRVAR